MSEELSKPDSIDVVEDARVWLSEVPDRVRTHWGTCHREQSHPACLVRKLVRKADSLAKELSAHRIALAACQSVLKSAKAELREADIMLAKLSNKQCLDNCCNRCSNAANRIIGDCLRWDPSTNGERDAGAGHADRGTADTSGSDASGGDRCNPSAPCKVRCAARPLAKDGRNDQRRIWSSLEAPPDGD